MAHDKATETLPTTLRGLPTLVLFHLIKGTLPLVVVAWTRSNDDGVMLLLEIIVPKARASVLNKCPKPNII